MTALATYDDYVDKWAKPSYRAISSRWGTQAFSTQQKLFSLFRVNNGSAVELGTIPSTAVACTTTLAGSIGSSHAMLGQAASGELYLSKVTVGALNQADPQNTDHGHIIIVDRLSHQGGLSGNINTLQTTNLPTAALTRYTSGDGVMAALEIHAFLGTATTATCTYTNQAGTTGRITQPIAISGSSNGRGDNNSFLIFNLQAGDTGVRAVADVTLAASTGTVGNIGVTLFRPLLILPYVSGATTVWDPLFGGCANFVKLQTDYSLFVVQNIADTNTSTQFHVACEVVEA